MQFLHLLQQLIQHRTVPSNSDLTTSFGAKYAIIYELDQLLGSHFPAKNRAGYFDEAGTENESGSRTT